MISHLIPMMTTEVYRKLPDQATDIINRLIAEANENRATMVELAEAIIVLRQRVSDLENQPGPIPPSPTGEWTQVLTFDWHNMGDTPHMCLENVQLGYGFQYGAYNSAREDMNAQIANGTLHSGTPPYDIAVPIYYDNDQAAGHVAVWDHGAVWSDKVQYPGIVDVTTGYRGWGELVGGQRVVTPAV